MNQMMQDAISMAQQVFQPARSAMPELDMLVAGETNLMGYGGLSNVDRLRRLFEAFNQRDSGSNLLDQCVHAEGVHFYRSGAAAGCWTTCALATALYAGRPGGGGAGRHWPHPHGLRARHSHRRHYGEIAGFGPARRLKRAAVLELRARWPHPPRLVLSSRSQAPCPNYPRPA